MNLYGEDCPTEAVDVPHSCSHQADDQAGLRPGRRIGYARVHSTEQSALRETVQALTAAGVTAAHIHVDRGTRAPAKRRPAWRDALADLRSGDVLLVPSLAGLARSQGELLHLAAELTGLGVRIELVGTSSAPNAGPAQTQTAALLDQMREDLLAELAAERDHWRAHFDGRRGRHQREIDPEAELAVIEDFDAGAPRTAEAAAARHGMSRAQLYRVAGAVSDGY